MGAMLSAAKTIVIPAVISLILFLISTYILIPLWRRYRNRYAQYLPLDAITTHTSSFRTRVQDAIARWILPSTWRMGVRERLVVADDASGDFHSDDGEELGDVEDDRRRALSLDSRNSQLDDSNRRLSRDLEEGFRDDSDEEEDHRQQRR